MTPVFILEDEDILQHDDWVRPTNTAVKSDWGPEMTFDDGDYKWARADSIFGTVHFGHTVKEILTVDDYRMPYEFIRGNPPHSHRHQNAPTLPVNCNG